MSKVQGTAMIGLLVFIAFWTYLSFLAQTSTLIKHDEQNLVKLECFVHADNADVHKLCVDHGYDR